MARANHSDEQWEFATDIFGRTRLAFSRASRLYFTMLSIRIVGACVAFVTPLLNTIHPTNGPITAVFSGFVLLVAWHVVDYFYGDYKGKAEWARRAALVVSGLNPSADLLGQLKPRLHTLPTWRERPRPDTDGFETTTEFGFQRLTEMIEERARWTSSTYAKCHQEVGLFLVAFGVFAVALFYFVSVRHIGPTVYLLGFLAAGSAFVFPEAFRLWVAFGNASKKVSNIDQFGVPHLRAIRYDPNATFLLVEDYTSAVETAPMFFPWIFRPLPRK